MFIVSNYNTDWRWILKYTKNYIIYDRSDQDIVDINNPNLIRVPNVGMNIYDYCKYFYEHYDDLADSIYLLKGNLFVEKEGVVVERHISKEKFDRVINNTFLTCLCDCLEDRIDDNSRIIAICGGDSSHLETNTNWYIKTLQNRYFTSYDEFLDYIFINPIHPRFVNFSPGACYIVEKSRVLKYSKYFWKNLMNMVSFDRYPAEAHIIERALLTIFSGNFIAQNYMNTELSYINIPIIVAPIITKT